MIDADRAEVLRDRTVAPGYVRPAYPGYCFSNVPGTAASILGHEAWRTLPDEFVDTIQTDVEHVVLLLIDGLGWEQFLESAIGHPFFDRLIHTGHVTPLTTVYPSETAACIPTIHTALQPVEHGQLGWYVYLPDRDVVVESFAVQSGESDVLGPDEDPLFSGEPIYGELAADGIASHTVEPFDSAGDPKVAGATTHRYRSVAGFALEIRRVLEDADGPTYCYGYSPLVDSAGHRAGTRSALHVAEIQSLSAVLEYQLVDQLSPKLARDTLLLVVADHGQVDCPPNPTFDLLDEAVLDEAIARDRNGRPAISGGPRNLHLFLEDEPTEAVRSALRERTDVLFFERAEAIRSDLWGDGEPCTRFEDHVGDVVMIPKSAAIWHRDGSTELDLVGFHGGLHGREQLVPFGAVRLDTLQD